MFWSDRFSMVSLRNCFNSIQHSLINPAYMKKYITCPSSINCKKYVRVKISQCITGRKGRGVLRERARATWTLHFFLRRKMAIPDSPEEELPSLYNYTVRVLTRKLPGKKGTNKVWNILLTPSQGPLSRTCNRKRKVLRCK